MPQDAAFLHGLVHELNNVLAGAKITKITMPEKDQVILNIFNGHENRKLLLCSNPSFPRIHFSDNSKENPAQPPNFCMFLRKRITGARIISVEQPNFERIVVVNLESYNDFGDIIKIRLIVEMIGRMCNLILVGEDSRIIDSLKRIDLTISATRPILPGFLYTYPESQDKLCPIGVSEDKWLLLVDSFSQNTPVHKELLSKFYGISPLTCREICFRAFGTSDSSLSISDLSEYQKTHLIYVLKETFSAVSENRTEPWLLSDSSTGEYKDFSFLEIHQYGAAYEAKMMSSFSELLDDFYYKSDSERSIKAKSEDILKILTNADHRIRKKLGFQRQELLDCSEKDKFRCYGDILSANLHQIPNSSGGVTLYDFYNDCSVDIKLDPRLSPSKNAQKFYHDYAKMKTAEEKLTELIASAENELEYIQSVFDELSRAHNESDLSEIRAELAQSGYIKRNVDIKKAKAKPGKKPQKTIEPKFLTFISNDGFTILVGKNNIQNDSLSTKKAGKNDYWFHVKNAPGSHVIVLTDKKEVPDSTLEQAAVIAATFSSLKDAPSVAVDYTLVRNLKKPNGAKPGMVIYFQNRTAFVKPDHSLLPNDRK